MCMFRVATVVGLAVILGLRETFFSWFILIFAALWGVFAVGTLVYYTWWRPPNWIPQIVQEHFVAIVGIPIVALIAMCVVILLRYSAGPIEFSALGFAFRGAAGQVVFWIFCFLALIAALRLLWPLRR